MAIKGRAAASSKETIFGARAVETLVYSYVRADDRACTERLRHNKIHYIKVFYTSYLIYQVNQITSCTFSGACTSPTLVTWTGTFINGQRGFLSLRFGKAALHRHYRFFTIATMATLHILFKYLQSSVIHERFRKAAFIQKVQCSSTIVLPKYVDI